MERDGSKLEVGWLRKMSDSKVRPQTGMTSVMKSWLKVNIMAIARINAVIVARIQRCSPCIQGTQDKCPQPIVLSNSHAFLTTKGTYGETQAWTLHRLRECISLSGSGKHIVCQEPWTLTRKPVMRVSQSSWPNHLRVSLHGNHADVALHA